MKEMLKRAAGIAVFWAILLALLLPTSHLLTPKDNWEADGMRDVDAFGFLGEPRDTLDVMVFGDSLAKCSFSPLQLWERSGITSYVCSTGNQKLFETCEYMLQALKNQSPSVILLEANILYSECPRTDILTDRAERLLPVIRYHDRWKTLTAKDWRGKTEYTYQDPTKGFHVSTEVSPAETDGYRKPSQKIKAVSAGNIAYLEKIAEICREKNVDLVLYSAPSTENWSYKRHNGIAQLAEQMNLFYLDLNLMPEAVPIDWSRDTMDEGNHLNCYGAEKVTAFLGDKLAELGIFADKRTDAAFTAWNLAAEALRQSIENQK